VSDWPIVIVAVLGTFALASLLGELLARRVRRRR
tara:strand:- start:219 stop:320 length:102 start_codon:yes stop_codon:yes gene_type:complete